MTKMGSNLILGRNRFFPRMANGRVCWFLFISYFLSTKRFHIRDSIFVRLLEIILQEYLSRKERAEQGKMCNVFLKEEKNLVKEIF